jgi:hypothetical protein
MAEEYKVPIIDLEDKGSEAKVNANVSLQINKDKIINEKVIKVEKDFVIVGKAKR